LADGDLLQSEAGDILVRITAKPEPVLTVTASDRLDLLRAAYHLGNRHIALEITTDYLRLSPDPVLQAMVEQLGLQVVAEIAPFHPEKGAYSHL
jgi:urease accessory protein